MRIIKRQFENEGKTVKCISVRFSMYRLIIAFSETTWYTEGVKRRIPIWIDEDGLFIYKLGVKLSRVS